jgi:hypothetical protein
METLNEVIDKKFSKSLLHFLKLVDPERKYGFETPLVEAWNCLTLTEQRALYLYCLYRKWRGEGFYGTPYEIISNCHPYPTDWNGRQMLNRLMSETKMVSAKHAGSYGIYTLDEAKVWQMTDINPLNFKL